MNLTETDISIILTTLLCMVLGNLMMYIRVKEFNTASKEYYLKPMFAYNVSAALQIFMVSVYYNDPWYTLAFMSFMAMVASRSVISLMADDAKDGGHVTDCVILLIVLFAGINDLLNFNLLNATGAYAILLIAFCGAVSGFISGKVVKLGKYALIKLPEVQYISTEQWLAAIEEHDYIVADFAFGKRKNVYGRWHFLKTSNNFKLPLGTIHACVSVKTNDISALRDIGITGDSAVCTVRGSHTITIGKQFRGEGGFLGPGLI